MPPVQVVALYRGLVVPGYGSPLPVGFYTWREFTRFHRGDGLELAQILVRLQTGRTWYSRDGDYTLAAVAPGTDTATRVLTMAEAMEESFHATIH